MLPNPASYQTYEGEKQDYAPVADPMTDRSANAINEALADVAAMTRMCPRGYVAFSAGGTVSEHDAVWGNDLSVLPTITVHPAGTGSFLVTWPSSVTDARGNSRSVNLRRAMGSVETNGYLLNCYVQTANTVEVLCSTTGTGGALADPANPMVVWVW